MLTNPAGQNAAYLEALSDDMKRDQNRVRPARPVPAELGAWQSYLNKILPPIPEHP